MGKIWISQSNGCWIQCFDKRRFKGASFRLIGPGDFPRLRLRERGADRQVRSLHVGPAAYVQCYREEAFYDTVFWLLPNQSVPDVADLEMRGDVDSIRLFDRPPFSHEPGYAVYMLWAANHVARSRDGNKPRPAGRRAGRKHVTRTDAMST